VHRRMYISNTLNWPLSEWEHPAHFEYRRVVQDIMEHWKTSQRPDLHVVYGEPADDESEPAVEYFGNAELLGRFRGVCAKIDYLRIRLQALAGNADTLIYKEQWVARVLGALPHFCELLYVYGPPSCGKDVDALFMQELLGPSFTSSMPTTDVIKMPGQQERGVEASTPSMAALQGRRVALVPEVPEGLFAWHRLKHFVEQQGVRVATRGNCQAPSYHNPTFTIFMWSNHPPNMGSEDGAARRTAAVEMGAQYGRVESVEDAQFRDDQGLKYRIQQGAYRLDMLWTAVAWLPALRTYATSIPKPAAVARWSQAAVPNPLKTWVAAGNLERCRPSEASRTVEMKKAAGELIGVGARSPNLVLAMRSAGFTLDVRVAGGTKRVCKFLFEGDQEPSFVRLSAAP